MKSITKVFAVMFVFVNILSAQDFGYEFYNILDYRSVGAGYSFHEFSSSSSNTLPDSARVKITSGFPTLEYRQLGLRIAIGYCSYTVAKKNKSSFSVYAESGNDFAVTGRAERNGLFIPLLVSASYVQAPGGISGYKDFDVGSLGLGTGVKFRYFARSFGFQISGTAAIHYATEGFSTEYGSSLSYAGEAQFIFPEIFLSGITAGYRYQFQNWNMSNSDLNYQRMYHGLFIGFLF
jgi:hypothetical protein